MLQLNDKLGLEYTKIIPTLSQKGQLNDQKQIIGLKNLRL